MFGGQAMFNAKDSLTVLANIFFTVLQRSLTEFASRQRPIGQTSNTEDLTTKGKKVSISLNQVYNVIHVTRYVD